MTVISVAPTVIVVIVALLLWKFPNIVAKKIIPDYSRIKGVGDK